MFQLRVETDKIWTSPKHQAFSRCDSVVLEKKLVGRGKKVTVMFAKNLDLTTLLSS